MRLRSTRTRYRYSNSNYRVLQYLLPVLPVGSKYPVPDSNHKALVVDGWMESVEGIEGGER